MAAKEYSLTRQSVYNRKWRAGKKGMQLWWKPEDLELISQAAKQDSRPMTQFVILAALEAAKKRKEQQ